MAASIVAPFVGPKVKLDEIPASDNPVLRGFNLGRSPFNPFGAIIIPPGTTLATVDVANAGACSTPANFYLSRDGIWPQNVVVPD